MLPIALVNVIWALVYVCYFELNLSFSRNPQKTDFMCYWFHFEWNELGALALNSKKETCCPKKIRQKKLKRSIEWGRELPPSGNGQAVAQQGTPRGGARAASSCKNLIRGGADGYALYEKEIQSVGLTEWQVGNFRECPHCDGSWVPGAAKNPVCQSRCICRFWELETFLVGILLWESRSWL